MQNVRSFREYLFERGVNQMHKMLIAAVLAGVAGVTAAAAADGQPPSDPQIVGIVQTANRIDIDHAKLALKKSNNPQVKEFANQMIADHTSLEKSVGDLAKKLG